jgi:WhiB family redox-sensing transcriptional regulator
VRAARCRRTLKAHHERGEPPLSDIARLLHLPADWTWPGAPEAAAVPADVVDIFLPDGNVPSWQRSANCLGVDPDLFFPERGGSTHEAKEVCRGCVVRQECLQYAVQNNEKFGIWGGLSERERRCLRRRRDGKPYQVRRAS